MKRWIILFLATAILLCGTSCGGREGTAPTGALLPPSISQEAEAAPAGESPPESEPITQPRVEAPLPQEEKIAGDSRAQQDAASIARGDNEKNPTDSAQPDISKETPTPVDLDLSTLTSTMVYAEIFNMVSSPDDYIDKTIRLNGIFLVYQDPETEQVYCSVIVQDATACCAQGFNIVMPAQSHYPDDYPPPRSEVTIVATIQADRTLEERGILFLRLTDIIFENISTAP